jgi:hypothetical protein
MKLVRLIKMCLNETYGEAHTGENFSDAFPIQNGLKQEDASSPLLFTFTLECTSRKVGENRVGLTLNGPQLVVCADDVNLLGNNINNIKKNTDALIDAVRRLV